MIMMSMAEDTKKPDAAKIKEDRLMQKRKL